MDTTAPDMDTLAQVLPAEGRSPDELLRLARLVGLLATIEPPPDPDGHFPAFQPLQGRLRSTLGSRDGEAIEEALLELYCHLHMHEAPYSPGERAVVDRTGGYWCHAGGLSPIVKAGDVIRETTVSADLGAGNGLQGLLLQRLFPHARTVQVEISATMVAIGRRLQGWLGVPAERVQWVVGDVTAFPLAGLDFIYLYRPVRPEGEGAAFYRRLAAELDRAEGEVVIFSIADCLRAFLSPRFEVVYSDGHLTCFRGSGA
jgi:hypothetical protein